MVDHIKEGYRFVLFHWEEHNVINGDQVCLQQAVVEATILLLGYVAMTRSAYHRKIPKIDYEQDKFRWEE